VRIRAASQEEQARSMLGGDVVEKEVTWAGVTPVLGIRRKGSAPRWKEVRPWAGLSTTTIP